MRAEAEAPIKKMMMMMVMMMMMIVVMMIKIIMMMNLNYTTINSLAKKAPIERREQRRKLADILEKYCWLMEDQVKIHT